MRFPATGLTLAAVAAADSISDDGRSPRERRSGSFVAGLRSVLTGPGLRAFRLLFATRLIGQFGDGAFQAALASFVVFSPQNEPNAGRVAAAFAVLLLPFTVVGPFAGVFLDRWPRRQVLIWANLLRGALVLLVALAIGAGAPQWAYYTGALVVVSVNRFVLAGLSASLPHTVPAEQLVTANSVCPTAGTLIATAGAAVGFVAHAVFSSGTAATVASLGSVAGLYALAALAAAGIARPLLGPDGIPGIGAWEAMRSVARGLAEGARHVSSRPRAGRALLAIAVSRFCYGAVTIITLLLCRNYFNNPADSNKGLAEFAFAVGVSAVGFGAGAVVTPFVTRRIRLQLWVAICLVASGVAELAGGYPFRPAALFAGAAVLGLTSQSQKISTDTLVQTSIDDLFRGRVFVYYDMLYNGAFVLAAAFSAASLPSTGHSYTVVTAVAALYAAAGLWYALRELRPGSRHAEPDSGAEPRPDAASDSAPDSADPASAAPAASPRPAAGPPTTRAAR